MVDSERFILMPGELVEVRLVRLRTLTLGRRPLATTIESEDDTLDAVIAETFIARNSERQGLLISSDVLEPMEK